MKRDRLNGLSSDTMYDNDAPSRIVIAYNFLGPYVNSLSQEQITDSLNYIGLNERLDMILRFTSNNPVITIDQTIEYVWKNLSGCVEDYKMINEEWLDELLIPEMDDIVLVEIHDMGDETAELDYTVYNAKNGGELSDEEKMNIDYVIDSIEDDLTGCYLIIVFVDIMKYGEPICQILFQ